MNLLAVTLDQLLVPIILVAFIVVLYFVYSLRNKKYVLKAQEMMEKLKPGVKLKTYSGIYGEVVEINEINGVKVALIKTGDEKHKSYFTIDASAIFDVESNDIAQTNTSIENDFGAENAEQLPEEKSEVQKELEKEKKAKNKAK